MTPASPPQRTHTQEERAPHAAREEHELMRREGVVRAGVLRNLGLPWDLRRVDVRPVSPTSYRVNVFTGNDAASSRLAHSFFLRADDDGNILSSSPPIARQY